MMPCKMPAICARLISDGRADRQGRRQRRAQHRLHLRLTHVPFPPRRAIPSILQGPPVSPARPAGTRPRHHFFSFFCIFISFPLSSCWLAVTHAAGARGCQSGAREPRTHRTHWLPGAGTPLFSLGLNHQLLSTRLSVAIAAKQGQEWQYGTNEERLLTFLHRDSGLCAPRLPTVLYPRSTGSNGTLLFEEQSASSTEKQRRVNSC